MSAKFRLKDTDKGYKNLVKQVFEFKNPVISVGIFEKEGSENHTGDDDLTVLEVATFNEMGLGVPERSFLRAYIDENESRIRLMIKAILPSVLAGKRTKEQALALVAQKMVGEIQKRIVGGIMPANAPSTIAAKGSSTPLIDTGQLRSSITWKVEEK